jgi:uncharacterized membrane protein YdjX (TVP38/TMEM64 family)
MSDPAAPPDQPPIEEPPPPRGITRAVVLVILLCLVAGATYALFFTHPGAQLRANPHRAGRAFQAWVAGHAVVAPLILIALYVVAALSLMPVWWIQILAGYGFGMWGGITYGLVGAVLSASAGFGVSRTLLADYVHRKFEAKHTKLRELDEKMGHNGLLIVMAARLMHFLPFGVANYLFGVSRITLIDVALGTQLGNAPLITFYVAVGAGLHPLGNWIFMAALTAANVLLLVPVGVRYWKPEWFKRIGVE